MTPRGQVVATDALHAWLSRCPRVALGHWPTPLVPLPATSRRLGIELWMKRDECSGLAAGGNKARKLEFVLGDALRQGARTVVTAGPVTSNHTMMTAAACRRLGLVAHVVLGGARPACASGNLLLTEDFGATVHVTPMDVANPSTEDVATAVALTDTLVRRHQAYFIPPGATMPESVPGYAAAIGEIAQQCNGTWPFDIVVTAHGTGSTAAGLWAGLALCGLVCRVVAIAVARRDALERFNTQHPRILGEHAWTHFGLPGVPSPSTSCEWVLGYGEDGYAVPSAHADAALRRLARDDGYLLDPVYTARAFAGLEGEVAKGTIPRGTRVLLVHTGGLTTTPLADKRKDSST